MFRVSHLLVDLGWVDFDLHVPPSTASAVNFPSAQVRDHQSHPVQQGMCSEGENFIEDVLNCEVNTYSRFIASSLKVISAQNVSLQVVETVYKVAVYKVKSVIRSFF